MKRKVVRHGPSTLIVSLPAKWAKSKGLKEKDEVEITEEENQLVISLQKNKRRNSTTIDITKLDRSMVIYLMHALYRAGFSKTTLNFSKPETTYFRKQEKISYSKVLHQFMNRFIGFEITHETSNSIEISEVSYIEKKEIDPMINRTFFLLKDIVDSFCQALQDNDSFELEKIEDKHDTITRLISFLLRAITRGEYPHPESNNAMAHTLANIDKIVDILKYITRDDRKNAGKIDKKIILLLNLFKESFADYLKLYRRYDEQLIAKFSRQRDEFKQYRNKIKSKLNNDDLMTVMSLTQALELLLDLVEWKMYLNATESVSKIR